MRKLRISNELYRRVDSFKPVVESVLDGELSFEEYVELLLHQAMNSMLTDLLKPIDPRVLLESVLQMGARHPQEVFGYVADTLRSGAAANEREAMKKKLGFQPPEAGDGEG